MYMISLPANGGIEPRLTVIQRGVDIDYFGQAAVNQTRIVNFADSVALPRGCAGDHVAGAGDSVERAKILLEALAKLPIDKFVCLLACGPAAAINLSLA